MLDVCNAWSTQTANCTLCIVHFAEYSIYGVPHAKHIARRCPDANCVVGSRLHCNSVSTVHTVEYLMCRARCKVHTLCGERHTFGGYIGLRIWGALHLLLKELHAVFPYLGTPTMHGVRDVWMHLHNNAPESLHLWECDIDNAY